MRDHIVPDGHRPPCSRSILLSRPTSSSPALRQLNESTTLAHVLESDGLTRTEIGRLTSLSKPTVSDVLRRLAAAGLIVITGHDRGHPGPPAEIYSADPDAGYAVAISVRESGRAG